MDDYSDTYLSWFILREIPGLTNRIIKQLISQFNTPEAILEAPANELAQVQGIGPKTIKAIKSYDQHTGTALATLEQIRKQNFGISVLTGSDYPPFLREIPDPPPVLVYDGKLEPEKPCISIVGSRSATRYGLDTARHLAARLADRGFSIVSGMALGIDTAAHDGALASATGNTVAVLGSGLGHIYPRQNKSLYRQIKDRGAVITEFNPDTPPLPAHFPQRNRIIAGISTGTIVVEAAQKSGSLITARLAGEYNREVFAVPGSIRSSKSRGTHALIKQGARLVENEMDIIDELLQFVHSQNLFEPKKQTKLKNTDGMDKTQAMVYKHLDPYPKHIDIITALSGLTSAQVSAILLDMELSGLIVRHPGNNYSTSEE
ncbi:MAG: DNA-processing protein DprA [Desulfobacterales bacterium]|nr:DNA-processing protein DprA [Desulfobacterales bacterium]